jgi:hypothetical protein
MQFKLISILVLTFVINTTKGQVNTEIKPEKQGFGIQYNQYLTGHPLIFSSGFTATYYNRRWGNDHHGLFISPQFSTFSVANEDRKFIFTGAIFYKYTPKKRFEATAFVGLNYILSRLDYDRYEYEGIELTNRGRFLHHVGPSVGVNFGYKIFKTKDYSISPNFGITLTQFNKNYKANLFEGYKPSLHIGINFNY